MKSRRTHLLLGLCLVAAPLSHAATVFFTGDNSGVGTIGNSQTYPGSFSVLATAWSTTNPNPSGSLAPAALGQYGSNGIGVCNSVEISNCQSPNHAVDNSGNTDFILLTFNQLVYTATLTLNDSWSAPTLLDTDTTYFVGNCVSGTAPNTPGTVQVPCNPNGKTVSGGSPNINTLNFKTLTYGTQTTNGVMSDTTTTLTINSSAGVNWILIGAASNAVNGATLGDDYFKITQMSYSTVPEPATFGLAGAALLGLGLLRKRLNRPTNI